MSLLRDEIAARVSAFESDEKSFSGVVYFDADFSGFKGHFPGRPILPGVCMIQAVAVLAARALSVLRVTVAQVQSAKFVLPIQPGTRVRIACSYAQRDQLTYTIKATLSQDDTALAKIDVLIDLADREA